MSKAMFPTKALKTYRGRGQIYSWLRAHHEAVAERLQSQEATWPSLAAEMTTHGVTGRWGGPPSANAILKVWRRVCGDLRKAEVADAERRAAVSTKASRPGSVSPSRTSPNWRPQEVVPQAERRPASPTPRAAQLPSTSRTLPSPFADTRTKEEIDAHVREQEAAMDEMFAKHDRKYRFFGGG